MIRRVLLMATLASLGWLGLGAATAKAGLVTFPPGVPDPTQVGPSSYQWNYTITLLNGQYITAGDFFTIIDFAGYQGSVSMPANWNLTVVNTSTELNGTLPDSVTIPSSDPDDPDIPNLSYAYSGPTVAAVGSDMSLGVFSVLSKYKLKRKDWLVSAIHLGPVPDGDAADGDSEDNRTKTDVPLITEDEIPSVPEPGTLVLMGLSLPLLGAYRVYRRRPEVTA